MGYRRDLRALFGAYLVHLHHERHVAVLLEPSLAGQR
jgi:hypothetical protein